MISRSTSLRWAVIVTSAVLLTAAFGLGLLVGRSRGEGLASPARGIDSAATPASDDVVTIIAGTLSHVTDLEDRRATIHVMTGSGEPLELTLDLSPNGTSVFVADLPRPVQSNAPLAVLRQATGEGYRVQVARNSQSVISALVVPPGFATPTPVHFLPSGSATLAPAPTTRTPLPRSR